MQRSSFLIFCLLIIQSIIHSEPTPSDNFFFTSGIGAFHKRIAYVDFGNDKKESIQREPIYTIGLAIGKNYRLPVGLRLKLPLLMEYGYAKEEETYLWLEGESDKQAAAIRSVLYNIGISPYLQYPFRLSSGMWGFVSIGGGILYSTIKEEEYKINEPNVTIVGDDYLEESRGIILSANIGSGIEFLISPTMSIDLQYLLIFSGPLSRQTNRDLFPLEKKKYTEFFISHTLYVSLLVPKIW